MYCPGDVGVMVNPEEERFILKVARDPQLGDYKGYTKLNCLDWILLQFYMTD